jgi:LPXTG-motif cell wall-anchored protein
MIGGGTVVAVSGASAVAAAVTGVTISSGACSGGGTSYCFTPEQANATAGDTVTWTNQAGVAHTVTSCTSSACPGAAANTGSQTFDQPVASANGSTANVTFSQAGTYMYYCKIHGYAAMHGTVMVAAAATQAPASQAPASAAPTQAPGSGSVAATVPSTGADVGPNLLVGVALLSLGGLALRLRRRT